MKYITVPVYEVMDVLNVKESFYTENSTRVEIGDMILVLNNSNNYVCCAIYNHKTNSYYSTIHVRLDPKHVELSSTKELVKFLSKEKKS